MPDPNASVYVTQFGAVGDNSHDDGPAIREAHNYCSTAISGKYIPLHFPVGRYRIDSGEPIQIIDGMHWTGEGHQGDETDKGSQIRYNRGPLFDLGGTRAFCKWTGLCFDGRSQAYGLFAPGDQLNYSVFNACGFKNFSKVFDTPFLGVRIKNSFWQNNLCTGNFQGSDNIIADNYISGSNWKADGSNSASAGADTFAVEFGSFRLNRFVRNFITGRPQMALGVFGSLEGTIINSNWFDICDWSGVYAENSKGGIFVGNTFNRCMLGQDSALATSDTTNSKYDSIVRLMNCSDMLFAHNYFGYVEHGLPKGNPIVTFHRTNCKRIQIDANLFVDPYKRLDKDD